MKPVKYKATYIKANWTIEEKQLAESDTWYKRELKDKKIKFDLIPIWVYIQTCLLNPKHSSFLRRLWLLYHNWGLAHWWFNWINARWDSIKNFRSSALRHYIAYINWDDDEDHAAALFWNIVCYESLKHNLDVLATDDEVGWDEILSRDSKKLDNLDMFKLSNQFILWYAFNDLDWLELLNIIIKTEWKPTSETLNDFMSNNLNNNEN